MVHLSVLELELGALEPGRQVGVRGLLDDAGTGEADGGTRLSDVDVGQQGQRRGGAAERGVGQDREVRSSRVVESADRGIHLRHLHEGKHSFLHAGATRS